MPPLPPKTNGYTFWKKQSFKNWFIKHTILEVVLYSKQQIQRRRGWTDRQRDRKRTKTLVVSFNSAPWEAVLRITHRDTHQTSHFGL